MSYIIILTTIINIICSCSSSSIVGLFYIYIISQFMKYLYWAILF